MRVVMIGALLSGCVAMAGCATLGAVVGGQQVTPAMVEKDAVDTCHYLPTDTTAAQLIEQKVGVGSDITGYTAIASAIASALCGAVMGAIPTTAKSVVLPAATARKMGRKTLMVPVLGGVPIIGRFVNDGKFVK